MSNLKTIIQVKQLQIVCSSYYEVKREAICIGNLLHCLLNEHSPTKLWYVNVSIRLIPAAASYVHDSSLPKLFNVLRIHLTAWQKNNNIMHDLSDLIIMQHTIEIRVA